MMEARKRGVLFDLGHGGGSFLWPVATKAMAQGFAPDTISTDLHSSSIMVPESDMPNCISKMMKLGMTLQDAILRSTVNPAKAIGRFPEIGTLGEGQVADVAVLRLAERRFRVQGRLAEQTDGDEETRMRADDPRRQARLRRRRPWLSGVDNGRRVRGDSVRRLPLSCSLARRRCCRVAQEIYDLMLKNGHVIDPKNKRNERLDIAITGGQVAEDRDEHSRRSGAETWSMSSDYYVTPGTDRHPHALRRAGRVAQPESGPQRAA